MTKLSEPVVFFGSGPVAAESLRRLYAYCHIEAVVTKPRPAHHKGPVPVLELAEQLKIPVHTVVNKKALDELIGRRPFKSRLGVLIDFGVIVNREAIDYFELGIINSHFSLLPEWRGADPITFAILSGQPRTGVSLMLLDEKMDEGPLLAQAPYDIGEHTTTPELTEALIDLSDATLQHVLPLYLEGSVRPVSQDSEQEPTYSRRLSKRDGILDPRKPADELEREIRAFAGWPGSRITLGSVEVIVTRARAAMVPVQKAAGELEVIDEPQSLLVYCGKGYLSIERLKPVGKNDMSVEDFLRGYRSRLG